jgi:hypothetical protein
LFKRLLRLADNINYIINELRRFLVLDGYLMKITLLATISRK